tara:strand:- start:1167 stop:1409 length:243 start_codon:yes stop_codon:yes gene_type:complete
MLQDENLLMKIHYICVENQDHRPSGLIYVNEKGLRAVSKLLGFNHKLLTPKQRKQFITDCRDCSNSEFKAMKTYNEYLAI